MGIPTPYPHLLGLPLPVRRQIYKETGVLWDDSRIYLTENPSGLDDPQSTSHLQDYLRRCLVYCAFHQPDCPAVPEEPRSPATQEPVTDFYCVPLRRDNHP